MSVMVEVVGDGEKAGGLMQEAGVVMANVMMEVMLETEKVRATTQEVMEDAKDMAEEEMVTGMGMPGWRRAKEATEDREEEESTTWKRRGVGMPGWRRAKEATEDREE